MRTRAYRCERTGTTQETYHRNGLYVAIYKLGVMRKIEEILLVIRSFFGGILQ